MTTTRGKKGVLGGVLRIMMLAGLLSICAVEAESAPLRFVVQPEQSQVGYISGTQLGEFRGNTARVTGEIVVEPQDLAGAQVSISVDPRELKSDNASRDQHMRDRLLEVSRYPSVAFAASGFKPASEGGRGNVGGTLHGTVKLHGVERPVSIPVRFTLEGTTLRGKGSFSLNLTDFGMTPPRLLGLKVRDQVVVEIHLVAVAR